MEKADGGKFIQIVKEHMERCSHMEPQDFGKLAFQSEFGPEHMMADRQQAESFLIEEWNSLPENNAAGIPRGGQESVLPVSESLCRFQLSKCGSVDEVKLLAHLFISTAEEHKGTVEGLEEKLEQLKELHIPSMEEWAAVWKQGGYPPVHHSRTYREAYQPHYRLIKKEYGDFFPVLSEIYRLIPRKEPAVVAIDGRCGSGKTYLAELIGKLFSCNICHMDDFYMPLEKRRKNWMEIPAGNMDLQRFLAEVLRPVRAAEQVIYRPYHCRENNMDAAVKMPHCRLTVVEGSYSRHPILAAEYDLTIFLTCSREEQRRRLQVREGDHYPVFENRWIPMEDNYFSHYSIKTGSHFVVDTSNF